MALTDGSKKILITGAGSGFGLGAAVKLADLGHHVIAGCVDDTQVSSLAAAHPALDARKIDITSTADVAAAGALDVDVLLNNAGRGQLGPMADVPMELVRQVFEVNVFGTIMITQAIAQQMKQRGSGRIIIVSSIAGLFSGPLSGPYAMTKHALEAMTRSLAAEMSPYGVEVCKLNPGPYATGFNDAMVEGVDEQLADHDGGAAELDLAAGTRRRMLGNQLDPQEVIDAMVQLCTADVAPYETFKPDNILERYDLPAR